MEVKTYRARSIQEALHLVRGELGPDASILHTRELRSGALWRLLPGARRIEVTAALDVNVPSRLPARAEATAEVVAGAPAHHGQAKLAHATQAELARVTQMKLAHATPAMPAHDTLDGSSHEPIAGRIGTGWQARPTEMHPADGGLELDGPGGDAFGRRIAGQISALQSMVEELYRRAAPESGRPELPAPLFQMYTELLDAEIDEDLARQLVERLHGSTSERDWGDPLLLRARLTRQLTGDIAVGGEIRLAPGTCHVAALVGPTGVGKTTTLAKLAAHFRLREQRKVGLITVDTYRIAAVEQLRTYADIIDLPMEVVSSPRDMRPAIARLSHLDLVLIDTAGRSPSDDLRIQELKAFLSEARADEVHLVLSSAAGASTLARNARQFAPCGVNGLILTKLDEAGPLGNVLPLLRESRLPLRYVTNGQNVPDDIEPADAVRLVQRILQGEG